MEGDEKRGDRATEPIENIWREKIRGLQLQRTCILFRTRAHIIALGGLP
ncbi:hypothetical protein M2171_007614 [Bradyrhizobium japonicum USDA 38]|nr:hypothetical protein [Bradyrhizobium japonicum USDA 38]MCS3941534.1 hypothetical protein [Bradyrhizobium japonicum]